MEQNWHKRIKDLRIKSGAKTSDVAAFCGLSMQGLNDYENGKNGLRPKVEILEKFSEFYRVSLSYILYGNEFWINLNSDVKSELSVILSMSIFDKILIRETDDREFNIVVKDKNLNRYLHYFLPVINNIPKTDLVSLAEKIVCIKNIKEINTD